MIKVLQYGLNKNLGGIEKSLDRLWSNIDHNDIHFDYVDEWHGKAHYRNKFEAYGSKFYEITPRREGILRNIKDWNGICSNEYPDILHCHMNTLSYSYPIEWALKNNIPVILHSRSSGMKGSCITNILHNINKIKLNREKIFRVAVSKEAGRWLFGEKANYLVIHNGIEQEKFYYSKFYRKTIRDRLKIDENTLVLGNVGHLSEEKNIPFMLDIIEGLKAKGFDAKLMIIGDGQLKHQIISLIKKKKLSDYVLLMGYVNDPEKYYSAMDIFIMPSLREGFPNAALEAQANGLKSLLSDTITREVNAGLCKYLSYSDGIENWISEILSCKTTNETIRKCANNIYEFSVEKEVRNYSECYFRIIEEKKNGSFGRNC